MPFLVLLVQVFCANFHVACWYCDVGSCVATGNPRQSGVESYREETLVGRGGNQGELGTIISDKCR